ncbi:DUF4411 family protein [Cellulomonas sp. 179-A 4D5 NHS]|uniref:DUF4411 family protein n=1 Tax=Cellulomonas sp. 179-A 4D5 NHS TaxID=3142378 RepID=UPI0039A3BD84
MIDSSAIIEAKKLVPLARQWEFFEGLTTLLRAGVIAFPAQVRSELVAVKYPDAPGAWIAGHRGDLRHPQPGDALLTQVLGVAPKLVDVLSEDEAADPYVLAMALAIRERHAGVDVVVATSDYVDRLPLKSSLASACDLMDVEWMKPAEFFEWAWDEIEWRTAATEIDVENEMPDEYDDAFAETSPGDPL